MTGASGYIGAHVCKNLVEHGYTVRACVRDASRADRTQHLLAMNGRGVGSIELAEADMMVDDSYDAVFQGCTAVFHVAANFGTDPRWAAATDVVGRVSPIDGAIAELSGSRSGAHPQLPRCAKPTARRRVPSSLACTYRLCGPGVTS